MYIMYTIISLFLTKLWEIKLLHRVEITEFFSGIQILREIKVGQSRVSKSAILSLLKTGTY